MSINKETNILQQTKKNKQIGNFSFFSNILDLICVFLHVIVYVVLISNFNSEWLILVMGEY